jgi:ABC-type sugar transport system permease subunit
MATLTESTQRKRRSRIAQFFAKPRNWMPYIFVAPFFITFAIFQFYPLLRSVVMSFQESVGYTGEWEWVGTANYVEIFTDDDDFIIAIKNFVYFATGSLITEIPFAIALALMLSSRNLKGRGLFRTLFFIPSVLPGVLMGLVGIWFFSTARGLLNALVVALGGERIKWLFLPQFILPNMLTIAFWQWMGYHAVFILAGMGGIDPGIIEAAIIDGATTWQRLRYIILPLLRPVLTFIAITVVTGSLQNYDIPAVVFTGTGGAGMGGPGGQGWFFLPYITETAFSRFRMGYATAIGWVVFAIAIVVTFFQLRLFQFGEAAE